MRREESNSSSYFSQQLCLHFAGTSETSADLSAGRYRQTQTVLLSRRLVLAPDERFLAVFFVPGRAAGMDPSFVWSISVGEWGGGSGVSSTGKNNREKASSFRPEPVSKFHFSFEHFRSRRTVANSRCKSDSLCNYLQDESRSPAGTGG